MAVAGRKRISRPVSKPAVEIDEHIVEIVSDSGEGAQKCGQSLGAIAARLGYGIWTVEIIPAEIQPPARSIDGASGNRVRLASRRITNGGDKANLVVAFNEQVLLGRLGADELEPGATILLEGKWRGDEDPEVATSYLRVYDELIERGFDVREVPMEDECLEIVSDPRRGKNMFVLGMLCSIYSLDVEAAHEQIRFVFGKKGDLIVTANQKLCDAGFAWAEENLDIKYKIQATPPVEPNIVINGNTSLALGVMASGMEVCAMYPITPATSVSHYLSDVFEKVGGVVHQAEDEIAAAAFAVGASYAGKCAVTITSGPGYSLKQEVLGLAVMAEIPLVVIDVQRGGPSTGQPTKAEQGDLLTACFGSHGDAPKVVMAASDIEDCFYSVITARRIAETFNTVVVLLSDASLATAQQPFPRPEFCEEWLAPPIDQSPVEKGHLSYDWNPRTGERQRVIPGQPNGMHTLTGLAHDRRSCVAYNLKLNKEGIRHRSLKLAALQKTIRTPSVNGDDSGEMLVVGWGSTRGAIDEAVQRVRADGYKVSSMHIRILQPLASGIREILQRFDKVLVVENNWADSLEDDLIDEENRRYSNLGWLLRARCLVDVDCWGEVGEQPIKPGTVERVIRERLSR
jgi:2-oxoglutarate ferredoxin oxidoreductase subunit alpha